MATSRGGLPRTVAAGRPSDGTVRIQLSHRQASGGGYGPGSIRQHLPWHRFVYLAPSCANHGDVRCHSSLQVRCFLKVMAYFFFLLLRDVEFF